MQKLARSDKMMIPSENPDVEKGTVEDSACATTADVLIKEPAGPVIVTELPGPRSKDLKNTLGCIQNSEEAKFFVDYGKSIGNYIADVDGSMVLDFYTQISSLPLGYNHPAIIHAIQKNENLPLFANRPALGVFPPAEYVNLLKKALLSVAPEGMTRVVATMSGANSNENAIKTAFIWYMTKRRGDKGPSEADKDAALHQREPGSPSLSILSFEKAFHGRTLACLSLCHTKGIHKVDIPAMNWPVAPYPQYKHPLEEHVSENQQEDHRCLSQVEKLIDEWKDKHMDVAGLIVEPIQAEGGDNRASDEFFRELQRICKKKHVAFIVDEVQTGCGASGKMWAHQYWNLPYPPDIMTFSKKMITGGFFFTEEMFVKEPSRIFDTWFGDPSKLLMLEAVVNVIKTENLLENVQKTGEVLLKGLKDLQAKFPNLLSCARGRGTFCAITVATPAQRNTIVKEMLQHGVNLGGCGTHSIRFRPSLICQPKHVAIMLDRLQDVLAKI